MRSLRSVSGSGTHGARRPRPRRCSGSRDAATARSRTAEAGAGPNAGRDAPSGRWRRVEVPPASATRRCAAATRSASAGSATVAIPVRGDAVTSVSPPASASSPSSTPGSADGMTPRRSTARPSGRARTAAPCASQAAGGVVGGEHLARRPSPRACAPWCRRRPRSPRTGPADGRRATAPRPPRRGCRRRGGRGRPSPPGRSARPRWAWTAGPGAGAGRARRSPRGCRARRAAPW